MRSRVALSRLSLFLLALAPAARAQGQPAPPDAAITASTCAVVVDSLAAQIERKYVFPELGKEIVRSLRRHAARGDYARITHARALADTLNDQIYAIAHDLHLRVTYDPNGQHMGSCGGESACGGAIPAADLERMRAMSRQRNFGFERVQRLAGNVGYLDLRMFDTPAMGAGDAAAAAMGFLANVDALIIDLRRNGGGDAAMVELLVGYLLEPGQRVHLFDFRSRMAGGTDLMQSWTPPCVPGPHFGGKDIYVLTGHYTGSAAESFAYAVQAEKLGTLVGEPTIGAGNSASGIAALPAGFSTIVATGVVTSPVTKTGWEGVGVKPDVAVSADTALRVAHVTAVKALLDKATTEEDRARLQSALATAEKTPPDPVAAPQGLRIVRRM